MAEVRPDDPDATIRITDAELGAEPAAGRRVFGRFVLEREIGRGGMGVVWQARDETLGETVALKFLPAAVARDAGAVDELKEETRRARRLRHEHIVSVFDFVQDDSGAAIAMELVDGATLTQLRLRQPGKIFAPEKLAPLVPQICSALDYAHTVAKIAHRDLKPANILVTADGIAKITDFGIARSLSETHTRLTAKDVGGISGTLPYMSPQQLLGKKPAADDDIYALGATLYELLTSKPPFFRGELATLMLQIRDRAPLPLAEQRVELEVAGEPIPPAWEETILACLAKEPASRPASAGAVAARLELAGRNAGVGAAAPRKPALSEANEPRSGDETEKIIRPAEVRRVAPNAPEVAPASSRPSAESRQDAGATPSRRAWWWLVAAAALAVIFWPKAPVVGPPLAGGPRNPVGPSLVDAPQKPLDTGPNLAQLPAPAAKPPDGPPTSGGPTVTPPPASVALLREFLVTVDPPDAGAHLWLGPQSDLAVPAGGRALVKDLPDGEHELVVQAPGYQPLTTRVTVKDGRGSAEAKLVAVKGAIEVTARTGTVVTALDSRKRETRVGSVSPGGTLRSENLLTIGSYTFRFAHDDCAPVELNAELVIGRAIPLKPAQTPLPGELRVFSVPSGAEVSVNGKRLGATPATLRVQPSETALAIEVFARGYRRSTQTVTLKPKEVRTVNVGTLAAESGGVALRMTNAQFPMTNGVVTVDGKKLDIAPALAAGPLSLSGLEVGARTVAITHPDYEPWKQSVTVRDQESTSVEVKLTPKPGRLAIRAEPREITLTVNGRAVRADEIKNGELTLPAGEALELAASATGYKSATRTLTLRANGADTWSVALEKLRGAEPGQRWTIPDLNLELVPIAAGTFTLGSENGDADEKPLTRVTLTKAFWLGKTEVTQREWVAVMGSNPSNFKGETLPVEEVSWTDAMEFCRKLTERERAAGRLPEGYAYTLPTEAQWEYACRAGTTGGMRATSTRWGGMTRIAGARRMQSARNVRTRGDCMICTATSRSGVWIGQAVTSAGVCATTPGLSRARLASSAAAATSTMPATAGPPSAAATTPAAATATWVSGSLSRPRSAGRRHQQGAERRAEGGQGRAAGADGVRPIFFRSAAGLSCHGEPSTDGSLGTRRRSRPRRLDVRTSATLSRRDATFFFGRSNPWLESHGYGREVAPRRTDA